MKAAARAMIFEGPGRPLVPRELTLPALQAGEVLVRVRLCTLCGSDLHSYEGRRAVPCPSILGHEMVGIVESLAGDARDLNGQPLHPGDRVVWGLAVSCGACFFCTHELPQKCERIVKYGHQPLRPPHLLNGGLSTHCHLLANTAILRLPDELPDLVAGPAGCATATVAAALRHAGVLADAVVLVQGAGMLGLTAAAMARSRGARAVLVCDTDPSRLALAERFGATHVLPAGDAGLRPTIDNLTQGRGADVALELSGASAAIEAGLELLRIGGRYVWVGAVAPVPAVAVLPERMVRGQLSIHGVHNYHPRDLLAAVEFLCSEHRRYPFAELVATTLPLEEATAAFAHAATHRPVRVGVVVS